MDRKRAAACRKLALAAGIKTVRFRISHRTRNRLGRDVAPDTSESDTARVGNLHGLRSRNKGATTPNDPKLSDSGPGARVRARRCKAKARAVPGFMAGRTAR